MKFLSGAQAGTQVFGQDPLWLAWATDLVNLKGAGDMEQVSVCLRKLDTSSIQSRPNDWFFRNFNGDGFGDVPCNVDADKKQI